MIAGIILILSRVKISVDLKQSNTNQSQRNRHQHYQPPRIMQQQHFQPTFVHHHHYHHHHHPYSPLVQQDMDNYYRNYSFSLPDHFLVYCPPTFYDFPGYYHQPAYNPMEANDLHNYYFNQSWEIGVQEANIVPGSFVWPLEYENQRRNYLRRYHLQEPDQSALEVLLRLRYQPGEEIAILDADGEFVNTSADLVSFSTSMPNDEVIGSSAERNHSNVSEATTISEHLKTRKYQTLGNQDGDAESEICVVCQSEYENEETLGTLRCGHEYHVDCIKRWLFEKNVCPVCKRTAI